MVKKRTGGDAACGLSAVAVSEDGFLLSAFAGVQAAETGNHRQAKHKPQRAREDPRLFDPQHD